MVVLGIRLFFRVLFRFEEDDMFFVSEDVFVWFMESFFIRGRDSSEEGIEEL